MSEPKEIDLFVTLRHLDEAGEEICYTGSLGDPVPVVKGYVCDYCYTLVCECA